MFGVPGGNNEPFLVFAADGQLQIGTKLTDASHTVKITTQEITTNIKQLDEKYIPDGVKHVQSDWNQNDETAEDHIKNRTHYEEAIGEYVIFDGTLPTSTTTGDLPIQYAIPSGISVTAYYNGSVVATVVNSVMDESRMAYLFDPDLTLIVNNNTMTASVYNGKGNGVLKFVVENFTLIHTLDEKYLPIKLNTKMDANNPVGTGSFSMGRDPDSVVGIRSHAEGSFTTASGNESHAEGTDTTASGNDSHAEGSSTTASGDHSHAEGESTTASGPYSHAEGQYTTASGNFSHAEGRNTTASADSSHAEGSSTNRFSSVVTATNPTNADIITAWKSKKFSVAKGTSSHVEGEDNLALANYSHAEGASNIASGYESHAEGFYTTASGNYSHAEGAGTTASFDYSHAEGSGTTASGYDSHSEGFRTTASGYDSHAEGYSTNIFSSVVTKTNPTNNDIITAWRSKKFSVAKGTSSHVEGKDSLALGEYAHAEGSNTTASGHSSHAEGSFTKASKDYQHVQGKFNIEDSAGTYADIIGNGTSDTARSNAATVDWSGNAWYAGDVYVGSTSGTNKDAGSKKLATEEYVSTELENYTPDPSLGITNATVGQIAKITAVDSNGKPTAWEPVDMASGGGEEIAANETIIASGTIASDLAAWKSFFAGELTVRELRNWKRFLFVAKPGTSTVVNVSVDLGSASYSVYTGNKNATTHYVLFEWLDSDRTVLDAWAVLGDSAIAIRDDTGYFINPGSGVNPVMGSAAPCRLLQQRVLDSQFDNATLKCFVNTAQTAAGAWTLHGLLQ